MTDIAGTTRDVLEEYINLHGITLKIADTAGIRQTEDIVEKIGVSKAKEMAADADLILYVVDSSVPLDENDEEIIKILQEKKTIVLYSKTDFESAIDRRFEVQNKPAGNTNLCKRRNRNYGSGRKNPGNVLQWGDKLQ